MNISNLFAIPLLLYKGLPLFAVLTSFLFVVALFGYMEWPKIILDEKLLPVKGVCERSRQLASTLGKEYWHVQ